MKIHITKDQHIVSVAFCCDTMSDSVLKWNQISLGVTKNSALAYTKVKDLNGYVNFSYCPFCGTKLVQTVKK